MQLAERRGELIQVGEIATAAAETAAKAQQIISALKAKSGRLYAAAIGGGEEALHIELGQAIDEALVNLNAAWRQLAAEAAENQE